MRYAVYARVARDADEEALEAQVQEAVELLGREALDGRVFVERLPVERTAAGDPWPELRRALQHASRQGSGLVLTRLGPLAGKGLFFRELARAQVPVRFVEMPEIEGRPTSLMLRALQSFAEHQSRQLSEATRRGIERAKENGVEVGGDRGHVIDPDQAEQGREEWQRQAAERREEARPQVEQAYAEAGSYTGAARMLNDLGFPTLSGKGRWHVKTVKSVLADERSS